MTMMSVEISLEQNLEVFALKPTYAVWNELATSTEVLDHLDAVMFDWIKQ